MKITRVTLLFLLPLAMCDIRRQSGRARPPRVRTTKPAPVVATSQPPVDATQPPTAIATEPTVGSAPQIIINLVPGSSTSVLAAPQAPVAVAPPAPAEASADPPAEATAEALAEAPAEATAEAPAEAPAEAQAEAPADAPAEAPEDAPAEAPAAAAPQVPSATDPEAPVAAAPPPAPFKAVSIPKYTRRTYPTASYRITTSTQRVPKAPAVIIRTTPAPRQPEPFKTNFVCKEGNGYYAVNNECDSYIECKHNQAKKYWCPDGLHFDPYAKRYEYPCAYPSVVKCNAGAEQRNPKPTAQCPRQYGYFPTNDGDCSNYLVCEEGAATIMPCPAGLVFDSSSESCDYVENVPQCHPNVFKDYTCPEPPLDEDGYISDTVYKYKYGTQCKAFIACERGYPRLLSCDRGLAFDEESQSCIDENYVQDCAKSYAAST